MQAYKNRQELLDEIKKRSDLFIAEFSAIEEKDKDKLLAGVDRTPAQMIAYQLGWMNLILSWEEKEQAGLSVATPHPDYKWNKLGGLYEDFYSQYVNYNLQELQEKFKETTQKLLTLTESYTDTELFEAGGRSWAASTPANWPIWKWIHINTVAPFKTFRTKIRKWKKSNEVQ